MNRASPYGIFMHVSYYIDNVNIICYNTQLLSIYYYGRIAEQTTGKAGSLLCGFLIIIVLLDFIW